MRTLAKERLAKSETPDRPQRHPKKTTVGESGNLGYNILRGKCGRVVPYSVKDLRCKYARTYFTRLDRRHLRPEAETQGRQALSVRADAGAAVPL